MTPEPSATDRPELAFYYPGRGIGRDSWAKTMLLYFDGIASMVPYYLLPRFLSDDLIRELEAASLIWLIDPREAIDENGATLISQRLAELADSDILDHLNPHDSVFLELSHLQIGGIVDPLLTSKGVEALEKRRLLLRRLDMPDRVDVYGPIRSLILVFHAQLVHHYGAARGRDLIPATDWPEVVTALCEILHVSPFTAGSVVRRDAAALGIDCSGVPVGKILEFKAKHGAELRKYRRAVREYVRLLSTLETPLSEQGLRDREQELVELEAGCRAVLKRFWRKPLTVTLGIGGAIWKLSTGDPVGALLAAAAASTGALEDRQPSLGAYTYLVSARKLTH